MPPTLNLKLRTVQVFDIKITNGLLLDGTGADTRQADIGIAGDRITAIAPDLSSADSRCALDASRKIVCPGFIDVHSHSDAYILLEPCAHSKLYQGITTEIVGNCGASAAPRIGAYRMPSDWADKQYPGTWSSVAEYRSLLESIGPAPNIALLIGHNALRIGIMGYTNRPAGDSELEGMCRLLDESLDQGGTGLSSGLIYAPAMFASREELTRLAAIAARHNAIYTSHIRSEGKRLLDAVAEAIEIGRATGISVEISHLKAAGKDNWGLIDSALSLITDARSNGLSVNADAYPYTSGCTDLDVVFPDWVQDGGREAAIKRLRDAATRARLREELLLSRPEDYWYLVTIGSTSHPDNVRFQGLPLREAANLLGMAPVDAVLYLAESDELKTQAFFSGISEANMMRILAEPCVMLCTDASLRSPTGLLSRDYPHPRAYGSFPKFLRMALDGKTVSLAEAVRKTTSLPAEKFGLRDRGIAANGWKADIVVFDPETIRDTAAYSAPHRLAEGIEHVIINGALTLSDGRLTGRRAGRFLSPGA